MFKYKPKLSFFKKNYEEILSLKREIIQSPDWILVEEFHCYGGCSEQDIDCQEIYYNQKLTKAIQFVIDYNAKHASMSRVPIAQLENFPIPKKYSKK